MYGATLLLLAPTHSIFSEWTGPMQYFAGTELLGGRGYGGWASRFYPPLFPLLVALVGSFSTGFVAGKLISIVSGSLLLLVAYDLSAEVSHRHDVPLWTQVFLALSPVYLYESLQADNHMLDALFFNCGLLAFLRSAREPGIRRLFLAGLICGLSVLTRYTSFVLLFLPLSFLAFHGLRRAAALAAVFGAGLATPSLPWWWHNLVHSGSLTHDLEYLNVCAGVFGHESNSLHALWRWAADPSINGVGAIVLAHPAAYVGNVLRNVRECIILLCSMAGALALLVVPGVLEGLLRLKPERSVVCLGLLTASVLAVSQAYVNRYMLLPWNPLVVALGVAFLLPYLSRLEQEFPRCRRWRCGGVSLGVLLLVGFAVSVGALGEYRDERASYRPLVDLDAITLALRRHDPAVASKVIMAIDPARAYYLGARYLTTPLDYDGTIEGLVCYRGVSQRLRDYAPRYPAAMDGSRLRADYLIYTRRDEAEPYQPHDSARFLFLLDPQSTEIPGNFRLVYRSADAVVYEVDWAQH